jgi:histidine phosphotransferase ChpT
MGDVTQPDDLELAALMCSRLCHDLISPVGAIANGFEVLDEEQDQAMRDMALDIIRSNGRKASARLQFARLAFGAMGGGGDQVPLDEARRLTAGLYEGEKVAVRWACRRNTFALSFAVPSLCNHLMGSSAGAPKGRMPIAAGSL